MFVSTFYICIYIYIFVFCVTRVFFPHCALHRHIIDLNQFRASFLLFPKWFQDFVIWFCALFSHVSFGLLLGHLTSLSASFSAVLAGAGNRRACTSHLNLVWLIIFLYVVCLFFISIIYVDLSWSFDIQGLSRLSSLACVDSPLSCCCQCRLQSEIVEKWVPRRHRRFVI